MKNLSTQEILELLRTLDHRGVSREEVLKALLSDVEKHKEIGEFLVMRRQEGLPERMFSSVPKSSSCIANVNRILRLLHYDHELKTWRSGFEPEDLDVKNWYDFGSEE